jgi:hypothetical protein
MFFASCQYCPTGTSRRTFPHGGQQAVSDTQPAKPDNSSAKPGAKPAEPPLEKPKVDVTVTPKEGESRTERKDNKDYAEKVEKKLKEQVQQQIDGNKGGGAKKQLDAAEQVADGAKKGVDGNKVDKVKIKVEGEVDGDKVSREKTVTPKGG